MFIIDMQDSLGKGVKLVRIFFRFQIAGYKRSHIPSLSTFVIKLPGDFPMDFMSIGKSPG